MDWLESLREIKKARENNQLVVFVGAGVSANSGIPTWKNLIKSLAKEIGYSRCSSCDKNSSTCKCFDCNEKFTQEEYLRIPEYFYQTKGKEEYFSFLYKELGYESMSNPIDDEILRIFPSHIITTNYDSLIENSAEINSNLYTVVSQDRELLSESGARYIVKMHGDLSKPETMVLKESDYLNYEQNHILISTFIKSLLINHSFVFIGYSLNDYNLNLIISWINYFRKYHDVTNSPKNFFIASKAPGEFERNRLKGKNIEVIDLNEFPINPNLRIPDTLKHSSAQRLFAYLRCITDEKSLEHHVPLEETLSEKYSILKPYNRISFQDLLALHSLGNVERIGFKLWLHDKLMFDSLSDALSSDNFIIRDTIQRAGITSISHVSSDSEIVIGDIQRDSLFDAYLDNRYIELSEALDFCSSLPQKVYYANLLGQSKEDISKILEEDASSYCPSDYILILLHKIRCRLNTITLLNRQSEKAEEIRRIFDTVPARFKTALGYLEKLVSNSLDSAKFEDYLAKLEEKYQYSINTWYSNGTLTDLWKIQAYSYDYYFFFKGNALQYDYFSEPKEFFSYYVRAILCTCSPVSPSTKDSLLGIETERDRYQLNEIDIDIIVKYCEVKNFIKWTKKYSVQQIEILEGIDIIKKFSNLCKSYGVFRNKNWARQIHIFLALLCFTNLTVEQEENIFISLADMLDLLAEEAPRLIVQNTESIEFLAKNFSTSNSSDAKRRIMRVLLNPEIYPDIIKTNSNRFSRIIHSFSKYIDTTTIEKLLASIDQEPVIKNRIKKVFFFRVIIPVEKYISLIENNFSELSSGQAFYLVVDKILPYSQAVFDKLIQAIAVEEARREMEPGVILSPDSIRQNIDRLLLLSLLDFEVDLSKLSKYAKYSEHLEFILSPESFDYKKVDTSDYMWENLFFSDKYQKYFIQHKNDLLGGSLKKIFEMGVETRTQQKMVYGFLLEHSDIRRFAR